MIVRILSILISASCLLVQPAAAHPQTKTYGSTTGVVSGQCAGQSCIAADIAGVTGNLPTKVVTGTASSWVCVGKYNPQAKAAVDKLLASGATPVSLARVTFGRNFVSIIDGDRSTQLAYRASAQRHREDVVAQHLRARQQGGVATASSKDVYKAKCTPNILIFAKGTSEFGELGETVGPMLRNSIAKGTGSSASTQWTAVGVDYVNTAEGNYCIGLPGGMIAKKLLESAAAKCPSSKIFLSGYSQGAMVVRIAVAYANEQARNQVKGVVTYGDPFNGAQIKGYKGPIKVFCKPTDAVCEGQFKIGLSHFAYIAGADIPTGAKWIMDVAKGVKPKLLS